MVDTVPGRRKPAKNFSLCVDPTERQIGETDAPTALFEFGQADRLAGERLGEEDVVATPLDRPVRAHAADLMIGIVPRLLDPVGIEA